MYSFTVYHLELYQKIGNLKFMIIFSDFSEDILFSHFLIDCSGVFLRQLNCSNLILESTLLSKIQSSVTRIIFLRVEHFC